MYGIAAQGIGYLWGKPGVLPLGQALFFGVAAYATAHALDAGVGLALSLLLAVGVMAVLAGFAFILAAVIFRGRSESGPYFSLITLALVMIAEQIAGTATDLTGGFNGFSGFDSLAGLDPFGNFYYVIVAATVSVSALLFTLNRLPVDLVARAVSDNEPRLQLLGFPTHLVKAAAFGLSAAIAALAGGLFASHQGIVTPTASGFALSAELVIFAAVGGRFHVFGPLLGAVVVGWASAELRGQFPYWELLIALAFILVVLKAPGGLSELVESVVRRVRPRRPPVSDATQTPPPPTTQVPNAPLRFDRVELQRGVVRILDGMSFETPATGIVSVIGPNGAGKTTALNAMTGNLYLSAGRISLGDTRIDSTPPHRALRAGLGRKLQVPSVFFSLTVAENLILAALANRATLVDVFRPSTFRWRPPSVARVLAHPSVALGTTLSQPVEHLPQGHRQFLELAMTVAAEPPVLLLDEPCAGLSAEETALMTELVQAYQAATGGLVIVIEHDMSIVEAISDKVLVLHLGQVLAFDSFESVRADPRVQAVYAGGTK
ncbi:MAG: ATP-binding cassette domain-containing protein [Pseudomonadota bacterium]